MFKKTNKTIILSFIITIILVLFLGFFWYFSTPEYFQQKLIRQCEQSLKQNNLDHQICKIEKDNTLMILSEEKEKLYSQVYPGDTVIFSMNLSEILKDINYMDSLTNKGDVSICFIIYPVLFEEDFSSLGNSDIVMAMKDFYDNYQWYIWPTSLLNKQTKSVNRICTNSAKINKFSKATAVITLPQKEKLISGVGQHSQIFGIKLKLIPPSLISTIVTSKEIHEHYSQLVPFFYSVLPINFQ